MVQAIKTWRWVLCATVTAALALPPAVPATGGASVARATERVRRPPNIVLILTDDQRRGTLQTMPAVQAKIADHGRSYLGVAPTSTCCPVRTSLLTGKYSHTTGIWSNIPGRHGGWVRFHRSGQEHHTIATALHRSGYRTALIGKYLNAWNRNRRGYVPPGWDVFRGLWLSDPGESIAYYRYWLKGTGKDRWYGDQPSDYSTDVLAKRAAAFVRSTPARRPFFLMWTPVAPHMPATPAPRHVGSWSASHPYRNRAVNEVRVGDKVRFIRGLAPVSLASIDAARDQTMESLRAVDDGVRRIVRALGPRVHNTLLVFASDQGYMWGEHRMMTKYEPYRWATEFPLFIRWDGRVNPGRSQRVVPPVDLTATILRAAQAAGELRLEGRSVLHTGRRHVVLEGMRAGVESVGIGWLRPSYCGVRTRRFLFVKWSGPNRTELYDYRKDPLELRNRAGRARYDDEQRHLHHLAVELCRPRPPGFSW